jgi:chromosome segregation ATPase
VTANPPGGTSGKAAADRATITDLQSQLAALDLRRAELEADNLALAEATRQAEESAAAARALVVALRQRYEAELGTLAPTRSALADAQWRAEELQRHLDAMYATKVMRATRVLRKVYGTVRHLPPVDDH